MEDLANLWQEVLGKIDQGKCEKDVVKKVLKILISGGIPCGHIIIDVNDVNIDLLLKPAVDIVTSTKREFHCRLKRVLGWRLTDWGGKTFLICDLVQLSESELLSYKDVGYVTLSEITRSLRNLGLQLNMRFTNELTQILEKRRY